MIQLEEHLRGRAAEALPNRDGDLAPLPCPPAGRADRVGRLRLPRPLREHVVDLLQEAVDVDTALRCSRALAHEHPDELDRHRDEDVDVLGDAITAPPGGYEQVLEALGDEDDVGEPDEPRLALQGMDVVKELRLPLGSPDALSERAPRRLDPTEPLDCRRPELGDDIHGKGFSSRHDLGFDSM